MSFQNLINQINEISDTQRLRGTYFEYLVQAYLRNEPTYKNEFSHVWMLGEVPDEYGIPKTDVGVDLVAKRHTGELVAVQAKFYQSAIQKSDVDSFLGELGKNYYDSGIIVASTDKWGKNAEKALSDRDDVVRIGLSDLRNSQIEWGQFSFSNPNEVQTKIKKKLRPYQNEVVEKALDYFSTNDRGQLIMAPGTGKTFTSLKVAEAMSKEANKDQFVVLYLVPSIQLLTQTLRGWNNDAEISISSMAVTSDRNASKGTVKQDESNLTTRASDIGYPATTSYEKVLANYNELSKKSKTDLLVVFGTYQSIDVLGKAQAEGFPEFDLIIADEAHRTTGATALGDEASVFVKVHSNKNVKGKKRLYQTATPKLFGMDAKKKAEELSTIISSMDDVEKYGDVFYRLGFGDAISQDYLTDYKLMVLAVDESVIQKDMQKSISDPENGLGIDDIGRIIGIWNGMLKRETFSNKISGNPMKRAIAFSRTIKDSQRISEQFESVVNDYLDSEEGYRAEVRHVDGGMNALEKNEGLDWLSSEDIPDNSARVLSNVRFLTEGIDVPNLDAIIFLSPRKSQVDIVQAVGRIIRKSPDKEYGYIILPIVIPSGETAESILDNNKTYDVIWQVLNALRSVDERFEATVNKLQLNKKKPDNIQVIGVGGAPDDPNFNKRNIIDESNSVYQTALDLDWEEIEGAIYGKIVQKVGDRRYLEDWSADVSNIARRHMEYIGIIISQNANAKVSFDKFHDSLRHNINDSITHEQAIEMLAQHLITLPIFEALFDEYSFVRNNPVGLAMEMIIEEFSKYGFEKEQKELFPFYESVKLRASGIDNAEAKQKIIVTLYDKFFSTGFKSTVESLGIVFTPVEVVDFIVKSVDDVLSQHFGKTLASEGVHILDPFTGTGTFVVRVLSYLKLQMDEGKITLADITRKYMKELHANEIVLLSYYIAAINIEATFDEIVNDSKEYTPFEGIVLTDTFETTEQEDTLDDIFFGDNNARVKKQKELPITVILGNPPYSIGARDENTSHKNKKYEKLDASIEKTYAKFTESKSKRGLYDSYIKAFRWASDRIGSKGVIGYITNNSFIDVNSMEGVRHCWHEEFNYVYVFNLRGAIRQKVGEEARKEGQNIFDIMTGVAITLLIKDGSDNHEIFYKDIGSYLSKKQKLEILKEYRSLKNLDLKKIEPDSDNSWINQGEKEFTNYASILDEVFYNKTDGVQTNRDAWVFNYSQSGTVTNAEKMIDNYNLEVNRLKHIAKEDRVNHLNTENTFVSWSRNLKKKLTNGQVIEIIDSPVVESFYRPFTKKFLYYNPEIIEYPRKFNEVFNKENKMISITGIGAQRDFSAIVINKIPEYKFMENGRHFYLYDNLDSGFLDYEGTDNFMDLFKEKLNMNAEDTFAYIYAVLNSPEYKNKFANNLRKELPRIPILRNSQEYVKVGHQLIDIHLNYENYYDVGSEVVVDIEKNDYTVKKMRLNKNTGNIKYNDNIRISNVPDKAYRFMVNGKSAIEWIVDQYQYKENPKSKIVDDPNIYSDDPKYVFHLLLSIINVSVRTVDLVNSLPALEIIE